jgi:hypothetical protein
LSRSSSIGIFWHWIQTQKTINNCKIVASTWFLFYILWFLRKNLYVLFKNPYESWFFKISIFKKIVNFLFFLFLFLMELISFWLCIYFQETTQKKSSRNFLTYFKKTRLILKNSLPCAKRQNLIFCIIMVFCYKKYPDLGDLAISHAIVSVNKLFKLFYTTHYDILCSISMTK